MWSSVVPAALPASSPRGLRPSRDGVWRLASGNDMPSDHFCRLLSLAKGMRPAPGGRSVRTVALAGAPARWTLDDVERISRGRPSKAKTGSRAVPHRLNAEERKAFELAKKRGYVVQKANGRRYPLINTYRNYCDALGLLCIRIEQGTGDSTDEVVLDFTPLHWSNADVSALKAELARAMISVSELDTEQSATLGEVPKVVEDGAVQRKNQDSASIPGILEDSMSPVEYSEEEFFPDGLEESSVPFRFQASSRSMAKVISQTALDVSRRFSNSKEKN